MRFPYDYLNIPEDCLVDKTVYKKLFYENTDLTTTDKKWFVRDIDSIRWFYTIKPELTQIPAFDEDQYSYDEIVVIDVNVGSLDHTERLADIMHKSIPYPLQIIYRLDDSIQLSVADKRFSQTDDQAATINKKWVTGTFSVETLGEIDNEFLKRLAFNEQSQVNLKSFYQGWIDAYYAYDVSKITGEFRVHTSQETKQQRRSALSEYRQLEQEIDALKRKLHKQNNFSEKVSLNMKIKDLQKQLNQISEKL